MVHSGWEVGSVRICDMRDVHVFRSGRVILFAFERVIVFVVAGENLINSCQGKNVRIWFEIFMQRKHIRFRLRWFEGEI